MWQCDLKPKGARHLIEPLISLAVALTLSGGFVLVTRQKWQRKGFLWLFLLVFFASWAGGIWLQPIGPSIGGVQWVQFLVAGLIIIGLIGLFTPDRPPRNRRETLEKLTQLRNIKIFEQATYFTLGILFWIILVSFVAVIVLHYLHGSAA
jgi:small neutral amino acid transporter SnatA (MarC family)